MYGSGKIQSKPKTQNIRNPLILEENNKELRRIIRDIWTFLETESEKKERIELGKSERKKKTTI